MHSDKYTVMVVTKAETRVCAHTSCTHEHTHGARRHTRRQRTDPAGTYSPASPGDAPRPRPQRAGTRLAHVSAHRAATCQRLNGAKQEEKSFSPREDELD